MNHNTLWFLGIVFLTLAGGGGALAAPPEPPEPSHPKTLDGVYIQAVETYINPRKHEIAFGVGMFPLDAYYNGFSGNIGYTHYLGNTLAWEVLNGSMVFSVQKDLTSQLAAKYGVNPERIEKLEYVASTGLVYTFTYGKSVLFKKILQYSRSGLIVGMGMVKTSVQSRIAAMLGLRFDGHINDTFSWRLEVRDNITVTGVNHFPSFSLGTGVYF
jgi:outer membrane beta-barrel protein